MINVSNSMICYDGDLFLAGLGGDLLHRLLDGGLVAEELHRFGRLHVLVKLVDEGNASWQVQTHDLLYKN